MRKNIEILLFLIKQRPFFPLLTIKVHKAFLNLGYLWQVQSQHLHILLDKGLKKKKGIRKGTLKVSQLISHRINKSQKADSAFFPERKAVNSFLFV